MVHMLLAADTSGSPLAALGVDLKSLIFQLITFLLVFLLLKRFAFKPITKMLAERRKTINDGVRLGQELEQQRAKLDEERAKVLRGAREEADQIVATAHKESRDVLREAEQAARRRSDALVADAEVRIEEEKERAKRGLEKDIVGLVGEATEAIVDEKVDSKKDDELIKKTLRKGGRS
jgi:F-type H+-transporting ATPase subunit b